MSLEPEKVSVPDPLGALRTLADTLARGSRSENTQRAYRSAWGAFEGWALENGLSPLPADPEVVAIYLAHLVDRDRTYGTIQNALVAICQVHLDAGHRSPRSDPRVRRVVRGVRRRLGSRQHAKAAVTRKQVDAMIATLGTDLRGLRDRAILSLGFATGMRRSELVALQVSDLHFGDAVLVVTIRVSKWNEGARRVRAAATASPSCPVSIIRSWLDAAGLTDGPLFRKVSPKGAMGSRGLQDAAVARLVKACAGRVGVEPASVSGHSLRSGFATVSIQDGASAGSVQRALGHATGAMTLRYVQQSGAVDDGGPFHSPAAR